MYNNQNDQSEFTQKNLFLNNGYQASGPKDFLPKKAYDPYYLSTLESKSYSFIVEWELPESGNYDVKPPESLDSEILQQ